MKKTDKSRIEEAIRTAVRAMLAEATPGDDMDDAEVDRLLGATRGMSLSKIGKSIGGSKWLRGDDPDASTSDDEDEDEEVKPKEKGGAAAAAGKKKGAALDVDNAHSLQDIASKLGVTHQQVSQIIPGATNKLLNRVAYLDDDFKDPEGVNLFKAYIKATPPQQLKKLATEFGSEVPPDAFVEDYIAFLSSTASGNAEDDFTPQELEFMRTNPEEVAKTEGYNEFKQEAQNDKRWLFTKSVAFRDFVRSKVNFQNFVSKIVQDAAEDRTGVPMNTKDSEQLPRKEDL